MPLYTDLADELADAIRCGALRPGERLPSVRQARASRRVSAATVFQAYDLLESRGLIESRPRSGFFVRAARAGSAAEPQAAPASPEATEVSIGDLVMQVLGSTRDRDVVPLGSAFPSPRLFPLRELARCGARALRALDPDRLLEDLSAGNERLRHQIARRQALAGIAVDPDEIVITHGAMEALDLSLRLLTRPGDIVAVESPTFYAALQALERHGLRAVELPTDPRDGIDPDALARVLERHRVAACWLMPNFQNPLGSLMPEERKRALVALLARHGVPLIEDDVYGELHHGSRRPLPAKAFDAAGEVLHCTSFSKCLAPGYRVGWVAAGRHAPGLRRLKTLTSLATAVPSQLAIAEYLAQGGFDRHLRGLRRQLAAQQARMHALVEAHFPVGTRLARPQGGYFLWVELPEGGDSLALQARAAALGISLAPGALFSASGGDRRLRRGLRLNFGHAPGDARIEPALAALGRLATAGGTPGT
ncbi:MAG: PLP-dependent aminotransferase family protein [Sphaerotilus natans subsp. sulfidivorans]|uniref:aminotransferase-like domain-containing protein n=1 Tax=Sphaerotilus sulfidivorans TaxID=639200 RepID=UPI002353DB19|nr:PLP-dependent aminotransferase family protein [Sphaerotilus sulfidivorans]MCK6401036.1 PLP-dependent aminotransferase family protein [Sphaerotilus sulfidivorans]